MNVMSVLKLVYYQYQTVHVVSDSSALACNNLHPRQMLMLTGFQLHHDSMSDL